MPASLLSLLIASAATVAGVLANSGQSCIAPTRLLVHQSQVAEATRFIKAMMEQTPVGDPAEMGQHIGPVVNKAQFDKIQGLIQSAIDEGATLVTGGVGRPDGRNAGYYVRPTLFADVTPDMRIAQEEVFGPVATVMTYRDEEEAISLANASSYGLNASVWSRNGARGRAVAARVHAGTVNVNEGYAAAYASNGAPMGGMKASGLGRRHGAEGITKYTDIQNVSVQRLQGFGVPKGVSQRQFARALSTGLRVMKKAGLS